MKKSHRPALLATRVSAGLAVAFAAFAGVVHAQSAASSTFPQLVSPQQSSIAPVVPADAPLSSTVVVNIRDVGVSIPDHVRALIAQYDAGTLGGIAFPLANELQVDMRAIRGLSSQVLLRWLDPLTLDIAADAPHFGANVDYTAFFGDGWDSDWQGDVVGSAPSFRGSSKAGWLWVNHEYVSNNLPTPTSAPSGQHLTLAKWLKSAGLLVGEPTSNVWSQADINTHVRFHKKNLGGSWVRVERLPSGKWTVVRTSLNRRYDSTSSTVTRLTGTTLSGLGAGTDHLDSGLDLSSGLLSGIAGDCSGGQTPWGTVVTAEENVQGYYGDLEACWSSNNAFVPGRGFDPGSNVAPTVAPTKSGAFGLVDNVQERHARDVYGYLVEIDVGLAPDHYYQPIAGGGDGRGHRKLGAMGRARWENIAFVTGADWKLLPGEPIVAYAADDRRSGRIYKFVSSGVYTSGMTRGQVRGLMDAGKLFVAHFEGLDNSTGLTLLGGGTPTEAAPGTGRWIELSVNSTDVAPNAAALGAPGTTVGAALKDRTWNKLGGFASQADVLRALFTASNKIGVMELNRPEDVEWNPLDPSGTPKLYVAFTNNNGRNALNQDGVLYDFATHATQASARNDRVGGVWAMIEADTAKPGSSTTFTYYAAWSGSLGQGLFDAANPDNLMIDSKGDVWFGTDGNVGTNGTADALYLIDLANAPKDAAGKLTVTARAFRVIATPSDAELTGPAFTPDERSVFVQVQHPGESTAQFPTTWPQASDVKSCSPPNGEPNLGAGGRTPVGSPPIPRSRTKMKLRRRAPTVLAMIVLASVVAANVAPKRGDGDADHYDPLQLALRTRLDVVNFEASVPSQCYTKTGASSNACWTCHTVGRGENHLVDWDLQVEYAFSDIALDNHWENLFADRSARIAGIDDEEILAYVREDNYTPLRDALAAHPEHRGYGPDLDFEAGFDALGFARDSSGWRAIRYQPFPGTFWPTNGNVDDVFIRLSHEFRRRDGVEDIAVYRLNLALLEASLAAPDRVALERVVEPVDEALSNFDLDGDGHVGGVIEVIRALPPTFAGDAAHHPLVRWLHPEGVEYLHTVRYLDPDARGLLARRMKEVRWSKKVRAIDLWGVVYRYEREWNDKEAGVVPYWHGGPDMGLQNDFGWQLKGFIEDAKGRLRLQTMEEQIACMGCHSSIGVTIDQTFTLPRKLPGLAGWAHQDLTGLADRPQHGHDEPEVLTYLRRVGGGDELRANAEMSARWFAADGALREDEVLRAAPGGDRDLLWLVGPSRERALALNKAYRALVEEQSFERGRDTLLVPAENVHRSLSNETTDLGAAENAHTDGVLWIDWSWRRTATGPAH